MKRIFVCLALGACSPSATRVSPDGFDATRVESETSEVIEPVDSTEPSDTTLVEDTITPTEVAEDTSDVSDVHHEEATSATEVVSDASDGDAVLDPCEPNPCGATPAPYCDGGALVTATSACDGSSGSAVCSYPSTTTSCAPDLCVQGSCHAEGDVCALDFASSRASVVTELRLGNTQKNDSGDVIDPCCFDFTGDDKIDNKMGSVFGSLGAVIDVNGSTADALAAGHISTVLDARGLDSLTTDPSFALRQYAGVDPSDLDSVLAGSGSLAIARTSFIAGTADARGAFDAPAVDQSALAAADGTVVLAVSFFGALFDMRVEQARITGTISAGPNATGFSLHDGHLGGFVRYREFAESLNRFVAGCECLTFATTMITFDTGKPKCQNPVTDTCTDGVCSQLPGYCASMMLVFTPDIDMTPDGPTGPALEDGISVGLFFESTSTTISGVEGCAP